MGHVPINPALIQAHSTDFRKNFCEIKSIHYICGDFHTDRRVLLVITGIFLCLYYTVLYPRVVR